MSPDTPTSPSRPAPRVRLEPLPAIAARRAEREGDAVALTHIDRRGRPTLSLTYAQMYRWAGDLAAQLQEVARPGDRVLVVAMRGLGFQAGFLASLMAGMVPVPVPALAGNAPRAERRLHRLAGIAASARSRAAIVPADERAGLSQLAASIDGLRDVAWLGVDAPTEGAWPTAMSPDDDSGLALLQYTSGSTSVPRGVMLTHGNVAANQRLIAERMGVGPGRTIVSWLPMFHDMGLSAGLLQPLYAGVPATVMEPETFLARPQVWLQAISREAGVMSGGPDFAYALTAQRVQDAELEGLELDRWDLAFTGAEPIRPSTLEAFARRFASCGFRQRSFYACYGLAESTLFVTGGDPSDDPVVRSFDRAALAAGRGVPAETSGYGAVELVGCGRPGDGVVVDVLDTATGRPCPEGAVGELEVTSASNGEGYWGDEAATAATFRRDAAGEATKVRTGDLGFFADGELFIVGRLKDMIIVNGTNHYPEDVEEVARRSHPLLADAIVAAFASHDEQPTVAIEAGADTVPAGKRGDVIRAVRRAVGEECRLKIAVGFVTQGRLPRTTSGKVRRRACAQRLLDGRLALEAAG